MLIQSPFSPIKQQDCANQFLLNGIGNCGRDPKCICSDKSFIGEISCCLAKPGGCNADDQKKAIVYASQLCSANGVSVPSEVVCNKSGNNGTGTATGTGTTPASGGASNTATPNSWAPRQAGVPAAAAVGLLAAAAAGAAAVLL